MSAGNGHDDDDDGAPPPPPHNYPELVRGMANLALSLNGLSVRLAESARHVARGRLGSAALDDLGAEMRRRGEEMAAVGDLLRSAG